MYNLARCSFLVNHSLCQLLSLCTLCVSYIVFCVPTYNPMFTLMAWSFNLNRKYKVSTPQKRVHKTSHYLFAVKSITGMLSCVLILIFFVSFQPLMVRFQAAYKSHLHKQQEKVNLELRELVSRLVFLLVLKGRLY